MSNNGRVIKLAVQKIEDYVEPKNKNVNWVSWGKSNDYPQKLVHLFNQSAKHGAIVTGKAAYISGKEITTEQTSPDALAFLKNVNPKDSLFKFLSKVVTDGALFGGYAILVVPNLLKDKPASFYHVDISKVRLNEELTYAYISDEWEKCKNSKPKVLKTVKIFDGNYDCESLILYTFYRPNIGTYPQPEYMQGLAAIETDARVSNFHLNNLRNGFFANKIININSGAYNENTEGQDLLADAITEKFTSDENAGKFLLMFNNGSDQATTVTDLSAGDFGEQFTQLRKDTEQEIFIAHKIPSPMLFGVRVEGQLGGRQELLEAFELFNKTYVEQHRQHYEQLINELAQLKKINAVYTIVPFEPMQKMMSEQIMQAVLTVDEIRAMYGYEPKPIVQQQTQVQNSKFSSQEDEKALSVFGKFGTDKSKFKKLNAQQVKYLSINDMDVFHASFNDIQKSEGVSEVEKKILTQIASGKQPKIEDKTLEKLREKKLVEVDQQSGAMKLTQLGGLLLTDLQPQRELNKLKTVYEYVKRPDASGPDILPDGRTRAFCEALIKSNKYFSREDITNISAELGYDVWTYRGGWYTMANGNHRPSCRHIWNAVLVAEK